MMSVMLIPPGLERRDAAGQGEQIGEDQFRRLAQAFGVVLGEWVEVMGGLVADASEAAGQLREAGHKLAFLGEALNARGEGLAFYPRKKLEGGIEGLAIGEGGRVAELKMTAPLGLAEYPPDRLRNMLGRLWLLQWGEEPHDGPALVDRVLVILREPCDGQGARISRDGQQGSRRVVAAKAAQEGRGPGVGAAQAVGRDNRKRRWLRATMGASVVEVSHAA